MKRIIAFVLSVVMLISVIPAQQLFAAGTAEEHYFELDTDGIDAGADYLIVSEKKDGVAYALQKGNTSIFLNKSLLIYAVVFCAIPIISLF